MPSLLLFSLGDLPSRDGTARAPDGRGAGRHAGEVDQSCDEMAASVSSVQALVDCVCFVNRVSLTIT